MEEYIVKLPVNGGEHIIIKSVWQCNQTEVVNPNNPVMDLIILHNEELSRGQITTSTITEHRELLQMNFEEYLNFLKDLLKNQPSSSDYVLTFDTINQIFMVEKRIDSDTTVQVVLVNVHKVEGRTEIVSLVADLYEKCSLLNNQLCAEKSEKMMILRELENTNRIFLEVVKSKETLENDLLTKFLAVLNEKKKEITRLKENKDLEAELT